MLTSAKNLLLIYFLLKPFYLFGSGGLQIADLFLLTSFTLICIAGATSNENRSLVSKVCKEHKLLALFVASTFIVNGLYFIVYPEAKFILSSLYYVFNLIAVITFAVFLKDRVFLQRVGDIFKINLILQLALWTAHIGRYYSADRYMGTFNDPNQFGYYVFLSLMFIYVIDVLHDKKQTYIYYVLALFLIVISGSTGMLLGMGIFSILLATYVIKRQFASPYTMLRRIMYSVAAIATLALPIAIMLAPTYDNTQNATSSIEESPIFERVNEKTEKASGSANISIFEDRGLDKIVKYPQLVIWGAGEGAFSRFDKIVYVGNEIHSTFPSIVFYYGLLPFGILSLWIFKRLQGLKWQLALAPVSLLLTSFVLLNQRQALFWMLIILAGVTVANQHETRRVEYRGLTP